MKKIDIITFGNLNINTGVNKVIENFEAGENIFRENSILINKIVGFNKKTDKNEENTFKKKIKYILKGCLEKRSKRNKNVTFLLIYLKYILRAKKTIKKYLNMKTEADVLIFNDIFSCSEYLKQIKINKKKIILILHTNGETFKQIDIYYSNQSQKTKEYLKNLEKNVLEKVDKIIFVSKSSLEIFNTFYKEYSNKAIYIYNGIRDIEKQQQINFNEKPLKFICVGTLNGRKGQELILETAIKLQKEIENKIIFYIVGGGPKYDEYQRKVKELKLENIIISLGNRDDIKELLEKSHIFILTSFDEGLPIAIIEAMRAGLPIISTKVGGIPEMFENNKEGFLIEPKIEDIEKVILKILNGKVDLEKLSYFSRKKYEENFALETMIKKYAEVINE